LSSDKLASPPPRDEAILVVSRAIKRFGGLTAVAEASFDVRPRSITALIGPNGAGKTTVFNLISGFLKPDGGEVWFEGDRITALAAHAVARRGLVRTFQIPRALTRLSVLENVMLASPHQAGEGIGHALFAMRANRREQREVEARARELLRLVRLDAHAGAYAGTLSGGQRKLLELARALMTEPRLVLLDEPMAGVNPTLGIQLLDHVEMLRSERGLTFVLIEHDMDVVMAVSDTVIVMDEGRVVAEGPPAEIRTNARVIEAYLGRHAAEPDPEQPLEAGA
jgi:ABC-type branched-subunit amino acid transport system ATPase component